MGAGCVTHPQRILRLLDRYLTHPVELTLYGRAALTLGFGETPEEYALSLDVDAVMWLGQAEVLNETTNFWDAVDRTNAELSESGLYISHFFAEDQVILRPQWRQERVALTGDWTNLTLHRLGDLDLLLSKLMRDDPIDHADAMFIVRRTALGRPEIECALREARIPDSVEIREQFARATARLLQALA